MIFAPVPLDGSSKFRGEMSVPLAFGQVMRFSVGGLHHDQGNSVSRTFQSGFIRDSEGLLRSLLPWHNPTHALISCSILNC